MRASLPTERLLAVAAGVFVLGLVLVFLVALHTGTGLRYDAELYHRASGSPLSSVRTAGQRTLATIDVGSLVAGALLLGFLALVRGRVARAVAAVAMVAVSVLSVEALKHGLPHIEGAVPPGRGFPSGHTAVAVSLGLALVLASPPVLRPTAALVGAGYAAAVGFSLVALGWHYPSDVVASFLVCGFWACLAGTVTRTAPRRPHLSLPGLVLALVAVATGLLVAAYIAGRHPVALAEVRQRQSLVATGALVGVLSLVTFGATAPLLEEHRRR